MRSSQIDSQGMQGMDGAEITFADTLVPVATLLGGVPLLTLLVMTAVRYVGTGSL